jgi:hypothetical protein
LHTDPNGAYLTGAMDVFFAAMICVLGLAD